MDDYETAHQRILDGDYDNVTPISGGLYSLLGFIGRPGDEAADPRPPARRYTATVENEHGAKWPCTLEIRGADPQGAFDWHCERYGLRRLSGLTVADKLR